MDIEPIDILIVEDSRTQAEKLKFLLEKNGYRVITAENGRVALTLMDRYLPSLILCDVLMPEMDGYEFCRMLKTNETFKMIPFVLLTTLSDFKDIVNGLDCGADNFITKPYNDNTLLSRIQYILLNRTLHEEVGSGVGIAINFGGKKHFINSEKMQILNLLISTYENAAQLNKKLIKAQHELKMLNLELEEKVRERTKEVYAEMAERKTMEEELTIYNRFIEIVNRAADEDILLREFTAEIKRIFGFEAVGIRLVKEDGTLPYRVSEGFDSELFIIENNLSIGKETCLCISLVNGKVNPKESLVTPRGSFYANDAAAFSKNLTEREKRGTEKSCYLRGYETVVLIPVKAGAETLGLIHLADKRKGIISVKQVQLLEEVSNHLGNALEKYQAERDLRQSEERYRKYFEDDLTGLYTSKKDGTIVFCNASFARILGCLTIEEAIGLNLRDLYIDGRKWDTILTTIRERRKIELHEHMFHCPNGQIIHVIENAVGVFDDENELAEIKGYAIDVTEKAKLEEQLVQSQKMEAIGRLAGGVAHDFNNMLMVISGFTDMLLKTDPGTEKRNVYLNEIKNAGLRAATITQQLLAFSRKQVLEIKIININSVVEETHKMIQRLLGEDIEIKIDCAGGLDNARADKSQLEQVLVNLAVNARDAMPGGGTITIETRNVKVIQDGNEAADFISPGDYVLLAISDTGTGMDAEVQKHIFEPFFTTKEKGKGTGLGLATSYGIIKQSSGYIVCKSKPGEGTTFGIYLPKARDKAESEKPECAEPSGKFSGSETVLLVEDEEVVRNIILEILKQQGYNVLTANNGREGLSSFKMDGKDIRVVLTDVVMPEMNGVEMAEALKDLSPRLPIIFMSGYRDQDKERLKRLSSIGVYLQKPAKAEKILEAVRKGIDEGRYSA